MVIGQTGAGKSAFIEFICGPNRVRVSNDAAKSCTKSITKLEVPEIGITIYDTPGFGDLEALTDAQICAMLIQQIAAGTKSRSLDGIIIIQPSTADRWACLATIDRLKELFGNEVCGKIQVIINKVEDQITKKGKKL